MKRSLLRDIEEMVNEADAAQLELLEKTLKGDSRIGVKKALDRAKRRLKAQDVEAERLKALYENAVEAASKLGDGISLNAIVGLDEVGRGSLAGPLAVGAVILKPDDPIQGLDDSKKLKPDFRERVAEEVRSRSIAWHVEYVEASVIDQVGIIEALRIAFRSSVKALEDKGFDIKAVLLDGNPMGIDAREVNIIKGDSKCAPIAAASIVAKSERDRLMNAFADDYPHYGFTSNKGYGTAEHRQAIAEHGLSDLHRRSYCSEFLQESLF